MPFGPAAQNLEAVRFGLRVRTPDGAVYAEGYDVDVVVVLGEQVKVVEAGNDDGLELREVLKEFWWEFV